MVIDDIYRVCSERPRHFCMRLGLDHKLCTATIIHGTFQFETMDNHQI